MLEGYELHGKNYKLVLEDHFEGDKLNDKIWTAVSECEKGHDDSLAYRRPENCTVSGSELKIEGLKEGKDFSSGKITTRGKVSVQYGYLEIRAKLPKQGRGVWPGFWTQNTDKNQDAINEIDIFEMFGTDERIEGTVHSWWKDKYNKQWFHQNFGTGNGCNKYFPPDGKRVSDEYMRIGLEWTPEYLSWMVDGKRYFEMRIDNDMHKIQHYPVCVIISMAFGLRFLGKPDDEHTHFPVEYKIDYFRIYQNETGKIEYVNRQEK